MTGANIIGYKNSKGDFIVNPDPDTKFSNKTSFIVLGTRNQLDRLTDYLSKYKK